MSSSKVRESLGVIESPRLGLVRSMRYPLALSRLLMIRFTSGDPFGWIREVHPETSLLFRCTSACRTIIEILVAALFQLADRLPEDYNLVCCPSDACRIQRDSPLFATGHRHTRFLDYPHPTDRTIPSFADCWLRTAPRKRLRSDRRPVSPGV